MDKNVRSEIAEGPYRAYAVVPRVKETEDGYGSMLPHIAAGGK